MTIRNREYVAFVRSLTNRLASLNRHRRVPYDPSSYYTFDFTLFCYQLVKSYYFCLRIPGKRKFGEQWNSTCVGEIEGHGGPGIRLWTTIHPRRHQRHDATRPPGNIIAFPEVSEMAERQFKDTGQIGETLNRLARQISSEHSDSPALVFQRSLDDIASSSPFTAAAVLSGEPISGQPVWSQQDSTGAGDQYFDQLTADRPELLSSIRAEQEPVQHDMVDLIADAGSEGQCFLIGVPAGLLADSPCSLGILSTRQLNDNELDHLSAFGRLVGMAAENARLTGLLDPSDGGSPANLIGLIAHELRTPLTGMRGNIQLALMSNQKGQTERVPERLEAAISSIDGMASLVQKLLDVSRLERGNFQVHRARADLRATAMTAIETALSGADHGGPLIQLADGEPVEQNHDQQAINLALTYLLTTVLGYRDQRSPITVAVHPEEQANFVEVRYTGSPMSEVDREALTTPLYARRPESTSGVGQELLLDLAYVRGVVLHHDGQISVDSGDSGTDEQVITIRLPADPTG